MAKRGGGLRRLQTWIVVLLGLFLASVEPAVAHAKSGRGTNGLVQRLTYEPVAGGAAETLEADYVLLAIGRRPYTDGLGLESVGITPDKRGFVETDHWKTSAPGVWAIGDVTRGPGDSAPTCARLRASP